MLNGLYFLYQVLASFIPVFIGLMLFKIDAIGRPEENASQKRLYPWLILANETQLYAYLLALYLIAVVSHNSIVTLCVKSLIILSVLSALIDASTLTIFYVRLDLTDAYKFMFKRDTRYTRDMIRLLACQSGVWGYLYLALLALTGVSGIAFLTIDASRHDGLARLLLLAACCLYIPAGVINRMLHAKYVWGVHNVLDTNITFHKRRKPYSKAFTQHLLASYRTPEHARLTGLGVTPRPNLILIVMESLSMYHSRYLSSIHDFTPHLDALMQENTVFTNFYANGLTSEDGLIALLLGKFPLSSPRCQFLPDFKVFSQPQESLPTFLQRYQYQTLFLMSADFDTLGVGSWAENIGFQMVKSRETMRFDHSRGLGFTTVTDDVLYLNALMTIQQLQSPYFITLETGLTHEPFVDPETLEVSEERCFKYADRKLFEFIQALTAQHFFDNGFVIVVSDHRKRGAMQPQEAELYGDDAFFRIPMVIINGEQAPRRVDAAYQQSDLFPSLKHLIATGDLSLNPMQGVFLPTPQIAPRYILAKHGGAFIGTVNVVHDHRCDRIILNGDRTRFEDRQVWLAEVIEYLNYTRLTNS